MFLSDEHASLFVNNTPKKFYNIARRKLTAIKCKKKISEKVKNWRKMIKDNFDTKPLVTSSQIWSRPTEKLSPKKKPKKVWQTIFF